MLLQVASVSEDSVPFLPFLLRSKSEKPATQWLFIQVEVSGSDLAVSGVKGTLPAYNWCFICTSEPIVKWY